MSRKPRILQVCAVDFTAYHFLLPLMQAQLEWGFDVEVACTPSEFVDRIEAAGIKVRPVEIARSRNPLKLIHSYREIGRVCAQGEYDVAHFHTPVAALAGRPAARRADVPLVLYTAHGFYFHDEMPAHKRKLHIGLERFGSRYTDYLFTQSAEDAATARAEGIATGERVMAIGNGIDLTKFSPERYPASSVAEMQAQLGLSSDEGPVVTILGRLVQEKGYMEFVEAWARIVERFPKARAWAIGSALVSDHDDSADRIKERAKELGVSDSLNFLGLRSDVPRLFAASDIFVLPSWREGMPRSIIEAMAMGLPVVTTDIRGCREEVVDGETGFVVPVRDPDALADAISKLVEQEDLRQTMGERGLQRAKAEYSEAVVIERQKAVYQQIFREKGLDWPA